MSLELTEEQCREVRGAEKPVRMADPETNQQYVLLRAEVYDRLSELLGEDFQPKVAYPALDRAFAEGWQDPKMDDYDRYEELNK